MKDLQAIADRLQELLGSEIDNGQLVINLNERRVQSVEGKFFVRIAQKVVATTSAQA